MASLTENTKTLKQTKRKTKAKAKAKKNKPSISRSYTAPVLKSPQKIDVRLLRKNQPSDIQIDLRLLRKKKTSDIHSLITSKIDDSNDPNEVLVIYGKDMALLLKSIEEIEEIDIRLEKAENANAAQRRASAFDLDSEIEQQTVAMGFDLDESTIRCLKQFNCMDSNDGVRKSSPTTIQRLKRVVKRSILVKRLSGINLFEQSKGQKDEQLEIVKTHADLKNIDEWSRFNIFHLIETFKGDHKLTVRSICVEIIETKHQLLTPCVVEKKSFVTYINKVCDTYNDVPYHNCIHGGDVLQGLHSLLVQSPVLREATPPNVMFACLMAALVHDVGHVGRTNHFLVQTETEVALLYNDQSVLENMHIATALQLTKETGCNIFAFFNKEDKREVRSVWISMILATDMAHHMAGVHELSLAVTAAKIESKECNMITPKKLVTTLGYLLHACDLSNPTKPFPIYNEWTGRVMEEFFAQSSEEKKKGIEITLPEKETANIPAFQIGFIRFITPFFEALHAIKDIDMAEQLSNLKKNLEHWTKKRASATDSETKGKEDEEKGKKSPHEH